MWLGERSHATRGQVICQVPSSISHVTYISFSPDDEMVALSADKQIYIVDVKVCIADFSYFDLSYYFNRCYNCKIRLINKYTCHK